ncbi:MAG TPA: tRNA (adenosine(37)-N6)-dimethylallyltransferase MiaA [Candidatus Saccharimonadia bacterium]
MTPRTLIAIVGPTASGKTELALQIAKMHNGEIICADSRTVYRGMDLGTAKPTKAERASVPHHLLDAVDPGQVFSVADFQRLAARAIKGIQKRRRLPVVVGGSGLYIDSLLYGFALRPLGTEQREDLSKRSDDELRWMLDDKGLVLNPSDRLNRRRLERAIGSGLTVQQPRILPQNYHMIGLNPGIKLLEQRIAERTRQWFEKNILEETDALVTTFGLVEPLNTPPYREIIENAVKDDDPAAVQDLINLHLRQLAKRQLTWFKRNLDIQWSASPEEAIEIIKKLF